MTYATAPCTCGGTWTYDGNVWICSNIGADPALDHDFALVCPDCGPKPLDEFTYAGDVSYYARPFGYTSSGKLILQTLEPEFDAGHENPRIFHDCDAYVERMPEVVAP